MRTPVLLLAIALFLPLGCARKAEPLVTADMAPEDSVRPQQESTLATFVLQPVCGELQLPKYPESLVGLALPPVSVKANLTIAKDGSVRDFTAVVPEPTDNPEPFIRAAESAVASWSCDPARRPPRPEDDQLELVPVDYRTTVVFRFFSDKSQHRDAVEAQFQ